MHIDKHFISIWFFIGSLLVVYGVLILGAGIYEWAAHSPTEVVLANLHVDVWWGAGMLVFGLIYVIRFWPRSDAAK
jgi:hypothetical protein